MSKTFVYVQNEISEGVNATRVFVNKDAYTFVEGIGYFRLISYTLNVLQGSIVHSITTTGKVSRHGKYETHYDEYMHIVEIPKPAKDVVTALEAAGFKKV